MRLKFNNYSLEPEIKFIVSKETIDKVLNDVNYGAPFIPAPIERDERVNVYYDTKDFVLFREGYECRRRNGNNEGVYRDDVKAPHNLNKGPIGPDVNGIYLRREYKDNSEKKKPQLKHFFNMGVKYLTEAIGLKLHPYVKGFFTRKRFSFSPTGFPDSSLEIAFENGHYKTPDEAHRSDDLYVIELELKSGNVNALIKTANNLKERYGLVPTHKTKGEMGFEFAKPYMKEKSQKSFIGALEQRQKRYKNWSLNK